MVSDLNVKSTWDAADQIELSKVAWGHFITLQNKHENPRIFDISDIFYKVIHSGPDFSHDPTHRHFAHSPPTAVLAELQLQF